MPHTVIAPRAMAYMLAAARLMLAQQLMHGTAAAAPEDHRQQLHAAQQDTAGHYTSARPAAAAAAAAVQAFGDAALATLPRLLDDAVLQRELMAKWRARLEGLAQAAEEEAAQQVRLSGPWGQGSMVAAQAAALATVKMQMHCAETHSCRTSDASLACAGISLQRGWTAMQGSASCPFSKPAFMCGLSC